MIGRLPLTLEIQGKEYKIRTDYRNILAIFEAYEDDELTDKDKVYICLKRLYVDFDDMPKESYIDAYKAANSFICCGETEKGSNASPLMSWVRDEQLIFPAINKVAGQEVRSVQYIHWWTFLGYFKTIDHEDLFSYVLSIRQKRAKHKKLEKWEREFVNNNKELFQQAKAKKSADTTTRAEDIFAALLAEGGDG